MKKIIIISALSLLLVSGAAAQTGTSEPTTNSGSTGTTNRVPLNREPIKTNAVEKREAIKDDLKVKREAIKTNVTEKREAVKADVAAKREEVKASMEAKREEMKTNMEAKRAEMKAGMEERKTALKEQLTKVKDEKKKQTVLDINTRLEELNTKTLDHFSESLDKLGEVSERITSRADKAEGRGLNVATVRTAIADALKAIEASRLAIQAQAGKTYTITVTTESNLRADVEKTRKALHDDLAKVRETVKAAHDAVRRAAVTLAQIPRVDEVENTSSTSVETPVNQ